MFGRQIFEEYASARTDKAKTLRDIRNRAKRFDSITTWQVNNLIRDYLGRKHCRFIPRLTVEYLTLCIDNLERIIEYREYDNLNGYPCGYQDYHVEITDEMKRERNRYIILRDYLQSS